MVVPRVHRRLSRTAAGAVCCLFVCIASAGESADLESIVERLSLAELDFDRAVDATGFDLSIDYGTFRFHSGVLVPAAIPDEERTFELVFLGKGTFEFSAPDAVEAQQLASFTGSPKLETAIHRAVLVLGDPAISAHALAKKRFGLAAETRQAVQGLYDDWVVGAEREGFGSHAALLRAMLGDTAGLGYVGIWLHSRAIGQSYYSVDPSLVEPVSLGAYLLFDEDDFKTRYAKKLDRKIAKNKEKLERKLGRSLDDVFDPTEDEENECGTGQDDESESSEPGKPVGREAESIDWIRTWVSARRPGAAVDDPPAVEAERYEIDMAMSGEDLQAKATARLRLQPRKSGLRLIELRLDEKLEVCEIEDGEGEPLFFERRDSRLLVGLRKPSVAGQPIEMTVRYAGRPVVHEYGRRSLRRTTRWYPRLADGLATFDLKLRWPSELTLLASGSQIEEGSDETTRWSRRVVDFPTLAVSFEIGDLDTLQEQIGHVKLTFGFPEHDSRIDAATRAEVVRAVKASLLFYETNLGRLPYDDMTVVVVRRGFSQGLLGFLTLAEGMVHARPISAIDNRTPQEIRLGVTAHEVAHQWWGHMVGWDSYRDQWLSEALAEFSSIMFMRKIARDPEIYLQKHAENLRVSMRAKAFDGRPHSSLGPVVVGRRLGVNHGSRAYIAVIYDKGAAVFETLAQRLGPESTWKMLGALATAVGGRVIRTSTFFDAMEHMSGQELDGFVDQYVLGTGQPSLFYEHRFERTPEGGWVVEGAVLQLPVAQFRHVLVRTPEGWDVVRRNLSQLDVPEWTNTVPFYLETAASDGSRSAVEGTLEVRGEVSKFSIPVEGTPADFRLDPHATILAELRARGKEPKRYLLALGEEFGRLGRFDRAMETLERALAIGLVPAEAERNKEMIAQEHLIDGRIHLARARILLDRDDAPAAKRELKQARSQIPKDSDYYLGERVVLAARLDLRTGQSLSAHQRLSDYMTEHAIELSSMDEDRLLDPSRRSDLKINRGEVHALLAVVAHLRREGNRDLLIRSAHLGGVDMSALKTPGS